MAEQIAKVFPSSPPRPGHRLARSITEVSPPSLRLHPRAHHLHSHHRTHSPAQQPQSNNSRRTRSSEKEREPEPQSAHPNLQPFLTGEARWRDGVKSEMGTPADSRRQSLFHEYGTEGTELAQKKRVVKEGQVKEEREKGKLRAKELRDTLITLHTQSNDASRRLDTTYYSVLEKLATLESSITALKEVASLTRSINDQFATETAELTSEITAQLETFGNFASQETRVQELAQRVQAGRAKIQGLGERVDTVKRRVEGWERAEGEWQEKTRRRLRVLWILMSVMVGVMVGLVAFSYTPTVRTTAPAGLGTLKGLNVSEFVGRIPGLDEQGNLTWSLTGRKGKGEGVLKRLLHKRHQGDGQDEVEDERLRLLDEL